MRIRKGKAKEKEVNSKWLSVKGQISHLFMPAIVVVCEAVAVLLCDVICAFVMCFYSKGSVPYDVAFALMTGITASGILAIITEMSNNYRRNSIRTLVLSNLFSMLASYETDIAVCTGEFDCDRQQADLMKALHMDDQRTTADTEKIDCDKFEKEEISSTEEFNDDEIDKLRDYIMPSKERVVVVLEQFPKLIPIVKDAYQNHCAELKAKEVFLLKDILWNYDQIIYNVSFALYDHMSFYDHNNNDRDEIINLFGARIERRVRECIDLEDDYEEHTKMIHSIAEDLLLRGEYQLKAMGIRLSDEYTRSNDDEQEEFSADRRVERKGMLISKLLADIDKDILQLIKMVDREPGYNIWHKAAQQQLEKYKVENDLGLYT